MPDSDISIAVEDQFVIFKLHKPIGMLLDGLTEQLIATFEPHLAEYKPVLDLGGIHVVTSDVHDFVELWKGLGARTIADETQVDLIRDWPRSLGQVEVIRDRSWQYTDVSMAHLLATNDINDYGLENEVRNIRQIAGSEIPTQQEWERSLRDPDVRDFFPNYAAFKRHYSKMGEEDRYSSDDIAAQNIVGPRYLKKLFQTIGKKSLMSQIRISVSPDGSEILADPFHSHAMYDIECNGAHQTFKPSTLATKTHAVFARELGEFSRLISDPLTKEHHLQNFLERNDDFLKFLGYRQIVPQVVLERADKSTLRPDFMAEPVEGDFWDVIDIKKPQVGLYVGGRDRKDFSSQVRNLCSQLREYSAYFDDPSNVDRVKKRYGIEAYKPKLVGIIGNREPVSDSMQIRRVHSVYSDCRILTFDQMLKIAKNRILI